MYGTASHRKLEMYLLYQSLKLDIKNIYCYYMTMLPELVLTFINLISIFSYRYQSIFLPTLSIFQIDIQSLTILWSMTTLNNRFLSITLNCNMLFSPWVIFKFNTVLRSICINLCHFSFELHSYMNLLAPIQGFALLIILYNTIILCPTNSRFAKYGLVSSF